MLRFFALLERLDWTLLISAITLTSISLANIYGIGLSRNPVDLSSFHKQLAAFIIGIVLIGVLVLLDYRFLQSYALYAYLFGALLLVLVLLVGHESRNVTGWFRLGSLSFQPVEIAKLTLTIYLASLFTRRRHGALDWRTFGLSAAATFAYVGLIMRQPDFGSSMVVIATWGAMCVFAGLPRRGWIILPTIILTIGLLLWNFGLKPYQHDRILVFLNPHADPRGSGYNAEQARIAIGAGGLFGQGIGEGSQARLRFLPEAITDFMIAVIGEEMGFVGMFLVLGLSFLVLLRYLFLAKESEDDFAALLLVGLGATLLIHITVNAGMNLGLMPITGIPMPFVSSAASSLVVAFLSLGIAQSIAVRRRVSSASI